MEKFIIKFITFTLLLAMLMPLAVACKDEPPANEDGGEGEGEGSGSGEGEGGGSGSGEGSGNGGGATPIKNTIDAEIVRWDEVTLLDIDSPDLAAIPENKKFSNQIDTSKEMTTVKYEVAYGKDLHIELPKAINIDGYQFIEFSIYSEAKTTTPFSITFTGVGSLTLIPNFTGWRTYRVMRDSISVASPFPDIQYISFVCSSTDSYGSGVSVYISDIKATNPVYELKVTGNADVNNTENYDKIIQLYKEYQIGKTPSSLSNYTQQINKLINNCKNSWEEFKATCDKLDESDTLFNVQVSGSYESGYGYPKKNGSAIATFYSKIANMSIGYAIPDSPYYQNEELLADIITCLEYGYTHYYGKTIAETGQLYGNWYCWDVTIPQHLTTVLTMIKDKVSDADMQRYLSPHKRILYWPTGYGSNRVTMGVYVIVAAALEKDALRLASTLNAMEEIFHYRDVWPEGATYDLGDGGIFKDGSFVQHGDTPYTGSYGLGYLGNITYLGYLLADNVFGLHFEAAKNQYEWIENNYRPVMFGTNLTASLHGRGVVSGTEGYAGMQVVRSALIMSTYAPAEYKDKLLRFVRTVMLDANNAYLQYMPLPFIQMADDIFKDTSILPESEYETARVFGAMDRIVQHTAKYGVCIALSSTRMAKYESINDANETGWYQGDGVIYVYTDGNDFGQWCYNWYASPYLMPGTTVNLLPRVEKNIYPAFFGSNSYAGGVEQGKYASVGFILGYSNKAYASGTFSSLDATKITAKKSYFMFDNEIVCIGSDIKDISGADVVTVVENRTWGLRKNVPVTDILHINGQMVSPESVDTGKYPTTAVAPQTSVKARTMHFTGMGGYVFMRYSDDTLEDLDGNTVYYQRATRYPFAKSNATDKESSNDFLEIVINHGKGDSSLNGKYAYIYMPESSVEETESYASAPDAVLLRRTSNVHAVLEKKLSIVAANFFAEDTGEKVMLGDGYSQYTALKSIISNTPACIMVSKGDDGQYHISASEPTQSFRQLSFEIEIDGVSSVISKDAGVTATVSDGVVYVTVATDGAAGASFDLTVK